MTVKDIQNYAYKNNIDISLSESIIIYNFIKRNYKLVLDGNEEVFNELKKELKPEIYNKAMDLYNHYKSKLF